MLEFLMSQIWMLVKGGGIGFAVAAPVGPIGMLCIRTTLERGRIAGLCAGLGAAVADSIFAAIGAYGISLVGSFLAAEQDKFKLIGGIFLIAFGIHMGRKQPNMLAEDEREVPKGLFADFAMTLALTLANPTTILSFAAIFASLSGLRGFALHSVPALLVGVFIGSAAWWLTLSGVVGLIRHRISPVTMLWINRFAGAAIILFGLYTLIEPLQAFAQPLVARLLSR
ncbi:MAG: LysE family translocator [Dongiaceae bacterium]